MASLVAQKPSDNPANPPQIMSPSQMISVGADPAALDDYLNLDLFGAGPATLRASNSPASSHGALPVTPGTSDQAAATASPRALFPALDASPSNGLSFLDSYAPLDKNFGAFPDLSMLPGSSMDLGMGTGLDQYSNLFQDMFPATGYADPGPSTSDALFGVASAEPQATLAPTPSSSSAIDPQLFTAPTPAPAPVSAVPLSAPRAMTVDEDDDEDDNSDDDASIENDEVAPLPTTSTRSTTVRRPRKNAGAAGGIAKRPSRASTPASIVPSYVQFEDPKPVVPPALGKGGVASYLNGERIGSQEPDEWRPTPEEYKKLSSKEKRQLRNKISARNFRVRRKEYISTLESHIADRDQLISAIRSELSTTRNENSELRREIDALKRAIQEGRLSAEATGLPPPRPLTPEGTPVTSTPARRTKEINRPNTRKDLSSNNSGRSFWGGAIGNGGVTPVHTAIIPEVFPAVPQLSDKRPQSSSPPSSASPATPPSEGVNMNPLMNLSPLFGSSKLPGSPALNIGLDVMGDAFNQRTLDGFRAQLWGRMAKEAGARSVGRERAAAMEGVETESSPVDSSAFDSAGSLLSQPSSSSDSPQQTMSSSVSSQSTSSTSPSLSQPTVSSSPSLSLLNSPSSIRSVLEPTASSSQPAPIPSLFQASIFGAGFGTGKPVHNTFSQQNASSAQARAMLQAQWLALQQSRQLAAATPNVMSEVQAQAAQRQHQPSVTAAQREAYLAQFAQAVSAHQAQQQAQQSQLNGMAREVRPAFFTRETTKSVPVTEKKSAIVEKLLPSTPTTEKKGATPQQAAAFATAASQTLLGRMGSAFWDAFSGAGGKTDTDKVRKVLEGKAVVRIVDIEKDKELDGLEERMKKLSVAPASLPSCSAACTPSGLGVFSNLRGKE